MTTEDDFQRQLDAHPDDWQARLVYADWLEERGDPRAEGYRALGVLRRVPDYTRAPFCPWCWRNTPIFKKPGRGSLAGLGAKWHTYTCEQIGQSCTVFDSRREAEDAAALAFAKLPVSRRAELLAQGVPA